MPWTPTLPPPPTPPAVPGWFAYLTVQLSGIPSAEAFGTPGVTVSSLTLHLIGIPSAEAFGALTVIGPLQTVALTGIPSGEAFGTPTVNQAQNVALTGIPSGEAFGTPTVTRGPVTVALTGIPSAEAFGTLKLSQNITLTGIASAQAFGTLTVVPPTPPAAVYDSSAVGTAQSNNGGSGGNVVLTHSHTVNGAGAYAIVVIDFIVGLNGMQSPSVGGVYQTIDFGGVALAYIGDTNNNGDAGGHAVYVGDISSIGTGAKTVTTTLPQTGSQAGRGFFGQVSSYTYTGVAHPNIFNKTNNGMSIAVPTAASVGRKVFGVISSYNPSGAFSSFSLTQRQVDAGSAWIVGDKDAASSSETVSASQSNFGSSASGFELRPAGNAFIVGVASAAGAAITLPAHLPGDRIVLFAYHGSSNTVPTKPTAGGNVPTWNDIDAPAGSNTNSCRTAEFVASTSFHTSGTWTGATGMIAVVVRGASGIGGHAVASGLATGAAGYVAPAITQTDTSGKSIELYFYGARNVTAWAAAPTGYTRQTSVATEVALNTKDVTTSDGASTQTATGTSAGYATATVEILT